MAKTISILSLVVLMGSSALSVRNVQTLNETSLPTSGETRVFKTDVHWPTRQMISVEPCTLHRCISV